MCMDIVRTSFVLKNFEGEGGGGGGTHKNGDCRRFVLVTVQLFLRFVTMHMPCLEQQTVLSA